MADQRSHRSFLQHTVGHRHIGLQPVIHQVFTEQPLTMIFSDLTSLCTSGPSLMTAYDPCLASITESAPEGTTAPMIWPVPAADHITVAFGSMERIIVQDPLGRIELSRWVNGVGSIELDISAIAAGMHLLSIQTRDGSCSVRTFIKQ
jgi:hypothetical protein